MAKCIFEIAGTAISSIPPAYMASNLALFDRQERAGEKITAQEYETLLNKLACKLNPIYLWKTPTEDKSNFKKLPFVLSSKHRPFSNEQKGGKNYKSPPYRTTDKRQEKWALGSSFHFCPKVVPHLITVELGESSDFYGISLLVFFLSAKNLLSLLSRRRGAFFRVFFSHISEAARRFMSRSGLGRIWLLFLAWRTGSRKMYPALIQW